MRTYLPLLLLTLLCTCMYSPFGGRGGLRAQQSVFWEGDVNADWTTAGNWLNDQLPTANDTVYIPVGTGNADPIITAGSSINVVSVAIQGGASLSVDANASLFLEGSPDYAVYNEGLFANAGELVIGANEGAGYFGVQNLGTVINSGVMFIDSVTIAVGNEAGTFTNAGIFSAGLFTATGMDNGIYNQADFLNTGGATVEIEAAVNGIFNTTGASFTNGGSLRMDLDEFFSGSLLYNFGTFNNQETGDILILSPTRNAFIDNRAPGTFTNEGSVLIAGATSSSSAIGLYNSGSVTIESGSVFDAEVIHELIHIFREGDNAGTVTINGTATMHGGTVGSRVMIVQGEGVIFTNTGTITADAYGTELAYIGEGATFTNSGTLTGTNGTGDGLMIQGGTVNNEAGGLISHDASDLVADFSQGIYLGPTGTLVNAGTINSGLGGTTGRYGLISFGTLENQASGSITIDGVTGVGIDLDDFFPGSTAIFNNAGEIFLPGEFGRPEFGLFAKTPVDNQAGGLLQINNASEAALFIRQSSWTNAGTIELDGGTDRSRYGIYALDSLTNAATGSIIIDNTTEAALRITDGDWTNAGTIEIGTDGAAGDWGLWNEGTFTNEAAGEIQIRAVDRVGLIHLGPAFLNAGDLLIETPLDTAINGDNFINQATGLLRGSGVVNGANGYAAGGTIQPGFFDIGVLTFSELTTLSGNVVALEINGPTAGTGYDQVVAQNVLLLTDAVLDLSGNYTATEGEELVIIDVAGTLVGTFAGLPEGAPVTDGTNDYTISYTGGDGNDVVLIADPLIPDETTLVWTGALSADWADAGNWSPERVPTALDTVDITVAGGFDPVVQDGTAAFARLIDVMGRSLTVGSGGSLTVEGGRNIFDVDNAALVVAESGTLIVLANLGAALDLNGSSVTFAGSVELESNSSGIELESASVTVTETGELLFNRGQNGFDRSDDNNELIINGSVTIMNLSSSGFALSEQNSPVIIGTTGSIIMEGGSRLFSSAAYDNSGFIRSQNDDDGAGQSGTSRSLSINRPGGIIEMIYPSGRALGITGSTVNEGSLLLVGEESNTFNSMLGFRGVFTIKAGSTLAGTGAIRGAVNDTSALGVVFEPGARIEARTETGPGCITMTRGFDVSETTLALRIEGTVACSAYSQFTNTSSSAITITDAELELTGDYVAQAGEVFTIFANESGEPFVGTFNNLPEGATVFSDNNSFTISYAGGGGNDITLTALAVLPVELLSFTGRTDAKHNVLEWTTALEENFSHYELQRSAGGAGAWTTLVNIPGGAAGAGQVERSYAWTDETPLPAAYYRLRSVDLDGTFSFSEVVYLERTDAAGMIVYPNPLAGVFTVELASEEDVVLEMFNAAGQRVLERSARPVGGRIRVTTTLADDLPSGTYLLVATSVGERWTRLVVRK